MARGLSLKSWQHLGPFVRNKLKGFQRPPWKLGGPKTALFQKKNIRTRLSKITQGESLS